MQPYEGLRVWRASHELALAIATATEGFPRYERYELTAQLRRAALSVPTNLVEGYGRRGTREFHRFVVIATGSINELGYLLLYARDRGYLEDSAYSNLVAKVGEVRGMLLALGSALRQRLGKEGVGA